MKNEIGRKLTSLTLMTIMFAGGMTIAAPGMVPEAHAATANLFVSAERASTDNSFGGPMVVEIVVNDPDLKETDEAEGQPDVTVNGEEIMMVQAADGNWYAYIAHETVAKDADATAAFDFGELNCALTGLNSPIADDGYFCNGANVDQNVVREPKSLSATPVVTGVGQVGLPNANVWPIIQLFDFADEGDVDVIYNKGGSTQQIELTYTTSMDDYSVATLDRESYTQKADVHVTIDDMILNIDPTDEDSWTFDTEAGKAYYQIFDENGARIPGDVSNKEVSTGDLEFGDAATLLVDVNPNNIANNDDANLRFVNNNDQDLGELTSISQPVTVVETQSNSGIFKNTDEGDLANIMTTNDAVRETTATIDYNDSAVSLLIAFDFGSVTMTAADDTWNSGETLDVEIRDDDMNRNSLVDEDFVVSNPEYIIPAMRIGSPSTLATNADGPTGYLAVTINAAAETVTLAPSHGVWWNGTQVTAEVTDFSDILKIKPEQLVDDVAAGVAPQGEEDIYRDYADISRFVDENGQPSDIMIMNTGHNVPDEIPEGVFYYLNYDIRSLGDGAYIEGLTPPGEPQGLIQISATGDITPSDITGDYTIKGISGDSDPDNDKNFDHIHLGCEYPVVIDIFSFGQTDDTDRRNDAIYRMEAEESGDNTGVFVGSIEYIMVNQINVLKESTYSSIDPITDELIIIVHEDFTDEDSPRLNYFDVGADGVATQVADQQEAPTHDGEVNFDSANYKIADTVTVTLVDQDLNTDVDTIDVYTVVVDDSDDANDMVGEAGYGVYASGPQKGDPKTRLLDITFDDVAWVCDGRDAGLSSTGFTLRETSAASGTFRGTFQVPGTICSVEGDSATGLDMEVNYVDFRDASGEVLEVGDSAGIRANTGSVSFDRTVYPVPWGAEGNATSFPLHEEAGGYLPQGNLTVHIRVNDPDFDVSASGEDTIATGETGPLKITVSRGSAEFVIATAGGAEPRDVVYDDPDTDNVNEYVPEEYGPINEIAPDTGIFELDLTVAYNGGPATNTCPEDLREGSPELGADAGCVLQGDIITVEYTDPTDASGSENTVTDSATFDLRNGVLQTDKSVYIIGSDMILTLIEPDFDLDNDGAETYSLDLIYWDSDADDVTMGSAGGQAAAFDPEPFALRETGDSTGIFQSVIEIPRELGNDVLDRGEEIELEYTDWGPAGANYVGDEDEDINLTIFTSNFGATIELDQKVYTWTDKVYITIVAPDHNFDSDLVDEIGTDADDDPLRIATSENELEDYKLVETGTDTGVFSGEVILTGFATHDADGDGVVGDASAALSSRGSGPTDGLLPADDEDGISVSFEFSEDETVLGSALIRWNIGEVTWLEASYPATATGVVRVVDPDMNLNPEAVDNFEIDVSSDTDAAGIDLTVTETNEATGIFEGTVDFVVNDASSGHRLAVSEGDTITAEYEDRTLPDPYNRSDEIEVTGTAIIGTIVPPLERAPASNPRVTNSQGDSLSQVQVDQQVQIVADLANGQDKAQPFAYLVQIQDGNGVTVSLSWIEGSLEAGQSLVPSQSWTPDEAGSYEITIFVWESVSNPTALSPALDLSIVVS